MLFALAANPASALWITNPILKLAGIPWSVSESVGDGGTDIEEFILRSVDAGSDGGKAKRLAYSCGCICRVECFKAIDCDDILLIGFNTGVPKRTIRVVGS